MNQEYLATIGLEIHAELNTKSKLFCGCTNDPNGASPNSYVCPTCMGYPGAMPYINKEAIRQMIRIGLAFNGDIANFSEFDRKHYFYPDIPKGYQISQYEFPIVSNGFLSGIEIERIHLEEDTAKSAHDQTDGSVIDFNRSGVPLMELVTKPVIHNGCDAEKFGILLQETLRYLGAGKARMEWGEMRVEVNISVSKNETLGTKVEVKNLNSFKVVRGVIEYEIKRQIALLEQGGEILQETRGWNDGANKTFSQRIKENASEYRYMPEPDLSKFYLEDMFDINELKDSLPILPEEKLSLYKGKYSLTDSQTEILVFNRKLGDLFDAVAEKLNDNKSATLAVNYITSDIVQYISNNNDILEKITPASFAELIQMVASGEISSRGAKDIIAHIVEYGGMARKIAEEKNLFQQSDDSVLVVIVDSIIKENPETVEKYKGGKEQLLQFFVGQAMKKTQGTANPQKLQEIFKDKLK